MTELSGDDGRECTERETPGSADLKAADVCYFALKGLWKNTSHINI